MRSLPILSALLFAAACTQQSPEPPANQTANAAEPTAEARVPALEGQWGLASIDGNPVAGSAMTATFAGGKAVISAGCFKRAWTYTQKRNVVAFTPDPSGSANCGTPPSAEQEMAHTAMSQASIAIFGKDGSEANLSGTGGNLTLQRR